MKVKTFNKNKRQIKLIYLIIFTFVNLIFISLFFIAKFKSSIRESNLLIFTCFMIYVNFRLTLNYFKTIRSIDSKTRTYYDLNKNDRKKFIISLFLVYSFTGLGLYLIFLKGLTLTGCALMIANGYTFLFFLKKLFKKHDGSISANHN